MSAISTFSHITRPYSALESWAYDRLVGPVLCGFFDEICGEIRDDLPEGGAVLDVGCGGGHIAMMVAGWRPDAAVSGIDLSAEQIARARERSARPGAPKVTFSTGDAAALPFDDDCFDVLISVGSIKHWPDPAAGLAECMRVLKPGGRFVITEADRGCRFEDLNCFVERIPLPRPLRFAFRLLYRTHVAGQSIDLAEARELLSAVPAMHGEVIRTRNGGLMFRGVSQPRAE